MKTRSVLASAMMLFALGAATTMGPAGAAETGNRIRIASSSTVYPFAIAVAEHFGKTSGFKTPVVESTGSGGGFKLFCAGLGGNTPDIVNASRRITASEMERCTQNGVSDIAEVTIGYDGIVLAGARLGQPFDLTREQLFKAIAKNVAQGGKIVANPYKQWSDIDASLPHEPIQVFGPAPNHGTRDILASLVMEPSCAQLPEVRSLSAEERKQTCEAIREDGVFIEVTENYTITLQKLLAEPRAVGILTYSYIEHNSDAIRAAKIDGKAAAYENIFSHDYPLSRPLYFYVKKAHLGVTPGIAEYVAEFTSEKAWGKDGYLADQGLIVLPDDLRKAEAAKAKLLPNLKP